MINKIDYEETDTATYFDELEIEVIAAEHQSDCLDHSGCAGCCFLLPILIMIIATFGLIILHT